MDRLQTWRSPQRLLEILGPDDAPDHDPPAESETQALAALGPARLDDRTATARLHPHQEAVRACAADLGSLIRAFHGCPRWIFDARLPALTGLRDRSDARPGRQCDGGRGVRPGTPASSRPVGRNPTTGGTGCLGPGLAAPAPPAARSLDRLPDAVPWTARRHGRAASHILGNPRLHPFPPRASIQRPGCGTVRPSAPSVDNTPSQGRRLVQYRRSEKQFSTTHERRPLAARL